MAKKRNAGRLPKYDPRETNAALSADLRDALHEKLRKRGRDKNHMEREGGFQWISLSPSPPRI